MENNIQGRRTSHQTSTTCTPYLGIKHSTTLPDTSKPYTSLINSPKPSIYHGAKSSFPSPHLPPHQPYSKQEPPHQPHALGLRQTSSFQHSSPCTFDRPSCACRHQTKRTAVAPPPNPGVPLVGAQPTLKTPRQTQVPLGPTQLLGS
jgi:hypothetical protein